MERVEKKYFTYLRYSANVHLIQIHNVKPLREPFEEYLQFSDRSTKELKGALIIDISKRKLLSPGQRTKLSKVINTNNESVTKNWTSIAYVNTSLVARVLLKGKLRMKPLPIKANVFTSLDEAVTWSYKIFLSNGVDAPEK
jgi:hypothetical protein